MSDRRVPPSQSEETGLSQWPLSLEAAPMNSPFRYFKTSAEVIRLAVPMYIRYPLSLRQVEDILFERGIDISHETIRRAGVTLSHRLSRRRR